MNPKSQVGSIKVEIGAENWAPQRQLDVGDFDKICRTCLKEEDELISISSWNYEDVSVAELLHKWGMIRLEEDDCLPPHICNNCLGKLIEVQIFHKNCQDSETILRSVLKTRRCKEEVKEEVWDDGSKGGSNPCPESSDEYGDKTQISDSDAEEWKEPKCKKKAAVMTQFKTKKRQKGPHKCPGCPEDFATREELLAHHRAVKHPEIGKRTCEICEKTFSRSKLRQHMRVHTKEKPFVCEVCQYACSVSGNLRKHMMTHTGEKPHVCGVCGKGFIQSTSLRAHVKTHARFEQKKEVKYVCDYCGRSFERLRFYTLHLKKHYAEDGEAADDVRKQIQSLEEVREHVCEICERAFKTNQQLKAHRKTHGEKTFLCSICGQAFLRKAGLQSHQKVHTGEKPWTCNICQKSFTFLGTLNSHMLTHTGERPFKCTLCSKAYTQLSQLKCHRRTHTGERPYSCSDCGKSFTVKGNLTVHKRMHTGETPFVCPVCNKGFYDSSSMKKHKRHHGENSQEEK